MVDGLWTGSGHMVDIWWTAGRRMVDGWWTNGGQNNNHMVDVYAGQLEDGW